MSDTVSITAIDQSQIVNGYVTVSVTENIGGVNYTPDPFTVQATDAAGVIAGVTQQAETYLAQVFAAQTVVTGLTSATTLASLVTKTINL
jgi:hypothetical protein